MFEEYNIKKMSGHWLLARMGKRVLRPGGKELTYKMISKLNVNSDAIVVEFAPGTGNTSRIIFSKNPKEYVGVDQSEEAVAKLNSITSNKAYRFVKKNIMNSELLNDVATVVLGEAVLTMQTDAHKEKIINEAYRILKKGGRYGIHEICLHPDNLDEEYKDKIRKDLSEAIHVNARPLTIPEWEKLFADAGFKIESIMTNPMHLLKPARLIRDEGFRVIKILFNVLTTRHALKRILKMRGVFNQYEKNMKSISIIAIKE
ncbi:MAG: class I SAM-dependent methyltransferase [Ignavibacteria bacterium]|nr:class I SAM-dependent methyltransferase [Ignavibacteria bacterium]